MFCLGATAGAVMGLILALAVTAVRLYKRRMEDVRKNTTVHQPYGYVHY